MKEGREGLALGIALVAGSAVVWSFGGSIAREIDASDPWTIVFWRAVWAALFLLAFMLLRDGLKGTIGLFRAMGWPGLAVAVCFAIASSSFSLALQFTTVANILLVQSSVPLIAALMAWLTFREAVALPTWIAIAVVISGVGIMVSDSLTGVVSPVGTGLAMLITLAFATATVIGRRFAHVRMTPACCLGTMIGAAVSGVLASTLWVTPSDMAFLFAFGALNLGLGLAFFATGVRLVPASIAALIGTLETILGPIWVWLTHDEVPSERTIVGGAIVLAALIVHLLWQALRREKRDADVRPMPSA
ncbi:MAG: DMT family transporter [Parvibaculaceae bacterium]